MPELPDLENFAINLQRRLKGRTLERLNVKNPVVANGKGSTIKKTLEGLLVKRIYREGKELRIQFNKALLGIHFMLRGKFFWFEDKNTQRHTLIEFRFSDGSGLALTDFQKRARITLDPLPSGIPDALSGALTQKKLLSVLDSKSTIKKLLLDQHRIRGIGNAYADEILWTARISPFSIGNCLPPKAVNALLRGINKVMRNAIKQIANADPEIIGGELRDFLTIHNADKKISPTGAKILKKTAAGRPTYYTNEQVLYK